VGIGVLASGQGSILRALLEAELPVDVVVVDRPCGATSVAEERGVPAVLVERTEWGKSFDRDGYTDQVVAVLQRYDLDLVAIAGFGTIIPKAATAYADRMVNTHPSLLPAFKGWHPVREALAYGVKVTGCTVHLVTEEVDAGPILAQEPVRVLADDTEDTLHERIKAVERVLYPATIKELLSQ
jgi:phosphoribosylglycinamide formyltransferase 1